MTCPRITPLRCVFRNWTLDLVEKMSTYAFISPSALRCRGARRPQWPLLLFWGFA